VLHVVLSGEIDLATNLKGVVPANGQQRVVVDASRVTFASSGLLAWLITIKSTRGLVVRHPSEAVRRLFEVSGLGDEFSVEP
jgi:anti-anti-sigma regulatory factor